MPGLVRKLVIFAAIDGLVLQPQGQRPAPAVQIKYKDNIITPVLKDGEDQGSVGKSFEAFGIVGTFGRSKKGGKTKAGGLGLKQRMHLQNWDMRANLNT